MNVLEELEMCARSEQPMSAEYLHDIIKRSHAALRAANVEIANAGVQVGSGGGYDWLRINDPDTFFAEMRAYRPGVRVSDFIFNIPELGEIEVPWAQVRRWLSAHMSITADAESDRLNWRRYFLAGFVT